MENLNKFVEEWEKTGNIEDILAQGLSLPSAKDVQDYLSSLPQDRQDRIRTSLTAAMGALAELTSRLETEAEALKSQIDQTVQASNACLSYNRTKRK